MFRSTRFTISAIAVSILSALALVGAQDTAVGRVRAWRAQQPCGQLARRGIVARQHAGDRQIVERDRDLSRDARGLRERQRGDRAKDARGDP